MEEAIKTKRCSKCGKTKSIAEFNKNRKRYNKIQVYCKICERKYENEIYHKKHPNAPYHNTEKRKNEKFCSKCKQWKSKSEFYKDIYYKDKLHYTCKKCCKKYHKEDYKLNHKSLFYFHKHKEKYVKYGKIYSEKCKSEWENHFKKIYGENPKCKICGKNLNFYGKITDTIHFDHRNGNELIKKSPKVWLCHKRCNDKYKKIWEQSNFGVLCMRCNWSLPTKNREQYTKNLVKYVFGEDYIIIKKPQTKESKNVKTM